MSHTSTKARQLLNEALEHLCSALERLDSVEAPANIGARIAQAIHELQSLLASLGGSPAAARVNERD